MDIVGVLFIVNNAFAKFGGILAEALQSLGYRQCARQPVDHAVTGELNFVLQVDAGTDEVCKATRDLTTTWQSFQLLCARKLDYLPAYMLRYIGHEDTRR